MRVVFCSVALKVVKQLLNQNVICLFPALRYTDQKVK